MDPGLWVLVWFGGIWSCKLPWVGGFSSYLLEDGDPKERIHIARIEHLSGAGNQAGSSLQTSTGHHVAMEGTLTGEPQLHWLSCDSTTILACQIDKYTGTHQGALAPLGRYITG